MSGYTFSSSTTNPIAQGNALKALSIQHRRQTQVSPVITWTVFVLVLFSLCVYLSGYSCCCGCRAIVVYTTTASLLDVYLEKSPDYLDHTWLASQPAQLAALA